MQIWRCEAWHEPLGSVFDLDSIADRRDRCTACVQNCYPRRRPFQYCQEDS